MKKLFYFISLRAQKILRGQLSKQLLAFDRFFALCLIEVDLFIKEKKIYSFHE